MDSFIGERFANKYRIIEILGEGASAKVYLAYDEVLEKNVALKILKNYNIDEKKIKNFEREAKAISMLDHDNIIKIYEIDEWNGYHYIAQEYVEGISLKEFIRSTKKIHINDVVSITKQILKGLDHAHSNKVIHKDIKSQNILYSVNKEVKITDFGIADILDEDATKTQSLMGTPQYVSPEILSKHTYSTQSDLYAVGIVMYELLLGSVPFVGEKPTIIMLKQLNQPLPSIVKERDDVPQSLENIVIKSTAKKLTNRYSTAQEMLDDMEDCLSIRRRNDDLLILDDDFDQNFEKTVNMNELIEEDKSRRSRKKFFVVITSLSLVLLLFLGALTFFLAGAQEYSMPNIVNKEYDQAENVLKNEGLSTDKIVKKYEENNDVPSGYIVSTSPKAGEKLTRDDKIEITISQGPEKMKLKNYLYLTESEAKESLANLGFEVEVVYEYSQDIAGTVISQNPEADSEVSYGDEIKLTVSQGVKEVEIPDFIKKKSKEVESWGSQNSMNISKTLLCDDKIGEGLVVSQNPAKGAKVPEHSTIEFVISTGKCSTSKNVESNNSGDSKKKEDVDKSDKSNSSGGTSN